MKMILRTFWQVGNRKFLRPPSLLWTAAFRRSISFEHGDRRKGAKVSGTMAEVKNEIDKRLGLEPGYQKNPKSREYLLQYQPKPEELPKRTMLDSFVSAIIPLSTDRRLQDLYVTHLGQVRIGRLMEDMDMFAVWICHQHVLIPKLPDNVHLPYTFVTILVDKVTYGDMDRTQFTSDIHLSGHVSWVGRSSMEIVVWLEQKTEKGLNKVTRALFMMAARNATNSGAAPVNQIVPRTEEEQKILSGGEKRKQIRAMLQANHIFRVKPTENEALMMHEIYQRTTDLHLIQLNKRILPEKCRWMSEWITVTTVLAFPEHRNAHNTVFGGFLMRQAVENSAICSFMYLNNRPKCRICCDLTFHMPVSVSSIIKLTSYIIYTEDIYLQLMTVADILDGTTGTQVTSNIFYFTYEAQNKVHEILPRSYQETIWYLEGKRKFEYALGEKGKEGSGGKEEEDCQI